MVGVFCDNLFSLKTKVLSGTYLYILNYNDCSSKLETNVFSLHEYLIFSLISMLSITLTISYKCQTQSFFPVMLIVQSV